MGKIRIAGLLIASLFSVLAHAEAGDATYHLPLGAGALSQDIDDVHENRFVVEAWHHFKQERADFGYTRYGQAQTRLEVGSGARLQLDATAGFTVRGLEGIESFAPHFGVEPFSGRISMDTTGAHERSYEWLPMASAGLQFRNRSCKLMPHLRAGGGLGNLGKNELTPSLQAAYGFGAYLNCSRFDLAAEATRVGWMPESTDLGLVDVSYEVVPRWVHLGLRAEKLTVHGASGTGAGAPDTDESRIMVLLRSQIFGAHAPVAE